MSNSKRSKIVSLLALVLCLAVATVFVFAFAGCDDEEASGYSVNSGDEYKLEDNVGEKIKISEEPDENGIEHWEYFYLVCSTCEDRFGCKGHDMYRTSTGLVYDFYPITVPMTLSDENGNEDINSKIQVSLIFDGEPVMCDDGEDIYFYARPSMIEILSLSGEPLDSSNFMLFEAYGYKYTDGGYVYTFEYSGKGAVWEGEDGEEYEEDIDDENFSYGPSYEEGIYTYLFENNTSSDTAKSYEPYLYDKDGYYVFYYTADDGEVYTFDFYTIIDSYVWGALVEGTVELR